MPAYIHTYIHDAPINNICPLPNVLMVFQNRSIDYCIGFKSSAILNGASVLAVISSMVTPSAISISVKPVVWSTSKTPWETN